MSLAGDIGWARQKKQALYNTIQCSEISDNAHMFLLISNGSGHVPVKLELRCGN